MTGMNDDILIRISRMSHARLTMLILAHSGHYASELKRWSRDELEAELVRVIERQKSLPEFEAWKL